MLKTVALLNISPETADTLFFRRI